MSYGIVVVLQASPEAPLFLFQGNDLLTWEIVVPACGPRANEC